MSPLHNICGPLVDAKVEARTHLELANREAESTELVESALVLMESAHRLLEQAIREERREKLLRIVSERAGTN